MYFDWKFNVKEDACSLTRRGTAEGGGRRVWFVDYDTARDYHGNRNGQSNGKLGWTWSNFP